MTTKHDVRLRKQLTANDLGVTGSHQAGIHVPKDLVEFFPELDPRSPNPQVWLSVDVGPTVEQWRLVYYNAKPLGTGTRDEYRITYVRGYLSSQAATVGDYLELERREDGSFAAAIVSADQSDDRIVLTTKGRWALIRIKRD